MFGRNPEAVDEAVRQVEAGEETEVDVALVEQLKKGGKDSWRRIGPLGKLHNIAVHIRSDSGRYRAFEELAGRQLGLDNDTRWNSWYILINRAIELEQAMDQYTKTFQDDLRDDFLTLDDWQQLKDISHFLHPFYRATLSTEGDNATLDRTLKTMDVLIKHFEKSKDKFIANTHLSACLMTGWYALDKYYLKSDNSPAYAAALILNPSYRKKYISLNWRTSWHKRACNSVKELWDSTYRDAEILEVSEDYSGTTSEPDEFDLLERDLDVIGNRFKDEYESYSNAEPVPYRGSVIDWWGRDEQRERYPRLSQMAIDILSIPPMSAEPERVFSGARRQISWERMQLGAANVERKECLKNWVRSGITSCEFVIEDEKAMATVLPVEVDSLPETPRQGRIAIQ
ncbi:hypothetical protein ARSEF1564_010317 [Beauveria bassiana]